MLPRINISSEATKGNLLAVIQRTVAAIRNWCDVVSHEAMYRLRPDARGYVSGRVTPTLGSITRLDLTSSSGQIVMPKADGSNSGMLAFVIRAKGSNTFTVSSSDPDTLIEGAAFQTFSSEALLISDGFAQWRSVKAGVDIHSALQGLSADDHTQYMHISIARTVSAIHRLSNGVGLGNDAYVTGRDSANSSEVYAIKVDTSDNVIVGDDEGRLAFEADNSGNSKVIAASTGSVQIMHGSNKLIEADSTGIGAFGATPAAKPTVTGVAATGTAAKSIASALATLGWVTDSTTET